MSLATMFPPLYECGACGAAVQVTPVDGQEPIKHRPCGHADAVIYANRKVTLHGTARMGVITRGRIHVVLTVRQLLSWLTGRSI